MKRVISSLLLVFAWFAIAGNARAQVQQKAAAEIDPDEARLRVIVKLALGDTTLEKVMAELSIQSGLTLQTADYLADRRLTIAMGGLPVKDVLDALAELYDWTWYRTSPGHYLLTRHTLRLPRDPAGIVSGVPLALPTDWRRYLRVGLSDAEAVRDNSLTETVKLPVDPNEPVYLRAKRGLEHQLGSLIEKEKLRLFQALKDQLVKGEKLSYSQLPPDEQRRLMFILTARHVIFTDYRLLFNEVPFFAKDLSLAAVGMRRMKKGAALSIGGIIIGADGVPRYSMSFGTSFDPETGQ